MKSKISGLSILLTRATKLYIIKIKKYIGRIVIDEMREISERLDKGNRILGEMNVKLDKLDELGKLNALDEIGDKLDSLPERIAEALKR